MTKNIDPDDKVNVLAAVRGYKARQLSFTIRQVAELLVVCRGTVQRYIRLGELETIQLGAGRRHRIPREAFNRFIARSRYLNKALIQEMNARAGRS